MSLCAVSLFVFEFVAVTQWQGLVTAATGDGSTPQVSFEHPFTATRFGEEEKKEKGAKKRRGKITIGRETTYVTGPLDEDGYVDYAAALNERLGQGATPANNANVLLWKAIGPRPDGTDMPARFFQLMGMQPMPEAGNYFIDLNPYMKDRLKMDSGKGGDAIQQELQGVRRRPWKSKEYPHIASWLTANEKPLALVVEATNCSHYFSPLVPTKTEKRWSGIVGILLPDVQKSRQIANALLARAMLRLDRGVVDEAWADLLTCHRLARLQGRGDTCIGGLVAIETEALAGRADLAFLECGKVNAKRIENCLRDLQKLPPLTDMAKIVELGERFMVLDSVMNIHRYGIDFIQGIVGEELSMKTVLSYEIMLDGIDWDPALQNINRWFDRMAACMREKDRGRRETELLQIGADLRTLKAQVDKGREHPDQLFNAKDSARVRGKLVGDIFIGLLLPALDKLLAVNDRIRQTQDNLKIAFALAWYQRENGRYPDKLTALAPRFLREIPQDLFSGKALIYHPSENGYLLYSVGQNGKDDGGRWYDDKPPGDDLSVRMPALRKE
jgi:hypothetical protein